MSHPPFSLTETFNSVDEAIGCNANIAEAVLAIGLEMYGIDPASPDWKGAATSDDMDKAKSTIRQLYRDWSAEGERERSASFLPMMSALADAFPKSSPADNHEINVLVPGAGLGRLVFEVCKAGYTVEGNEISYHQLLAGNWALNHQPIPRQHKFFPWALNFSNHTHRKHQLQQLSIPDIAPAQELNNASSSSGSKVHAFERMSMSSGDFCVLYKRRHYTDTFDAVLTCFFIDTAPNLISYIETVRNCLKDGGVWINLGPLLWHFDGGASRAKAERIDLDTDTDLGIAEAGSVELTDEEVLDLLRHYEFDVIRHEQGDMSTGYIQDPHSMLQNTYRSSFWVAMKK